MKVRTAERRAKDVLAHRVLKRKKQAIVRGYKSERGCSRCPENHPAALDLHHRQGENKSPRLIPRRKDGTSRNGGNGWTGLSYAELEEELAKCDVLCANCHRKEHFGSA